MTRMHNLPHPGLTLRDDVLPALTLTVTDAAAALGVSRPALSQVLNGAFGLRAAEQKSKGVIRKVTPLPAALLPATGA